MATGIRINGAKNFAGELYATRPWVLKYLEGLGLGTDFKWSEVLEGINGSIAAAKAAADAAQGTADEANGKFGTFVANKLATVNAAGTALEYVNSIVTSVGEVGEDNNIATEKAVRTAIDTAVAAAKEEITAAAIGIEEGEGINIATSGTNNVISVEVKAGEKVLGVGADGLYTDIKLKAIAVPEDEVNISKRYALVGAKDAQLGDVVIDIPKDRFLKSASYDTTTNALTFEFNLADGTTKTETVDLKGLMNVYKAGNGLEVRTVEGEEGAYFDVKIDANSEKVVTGKDAEGNDIASDVISVGADGVKASNVQAAIDYAVNAVKEVAVKLVEVEVKVPVNQTKVFTATVAGRVISVYGAEGVIYPEIKYDGVNTTLTADFGDLVVEAGETWTAVVAKPLASN